MLTIHVRHRVNRGKDPFRKIAFGTLLFFIGGVSTGIADEATAGREIAETKCSRCHSVDLSGKSPLSPAPPFRTLHERYPLESLEEALAEGILVGHSPMPEFKLSSQEVGQLIGYMKSLNGTPQ